jgi:hypothetical protein
MSRIASTDVINASAYITNREGYIKRTDDARVTCTADKVLDAIETNSISDSDFNSVKDRVIGWLEFINDSEHQSGEYFDNIRLEASKPMMDEIKIGLIASSFASYDRSCSFKEKNNIDKMSNFIGEEGDKVIFNIADYKLVKTGDSKFSKKNEKWYLYKIHDDLGNVIVFFANHDCEYDFNKYKKAAATISKLNTFNEVKQTNVSKLQFM